MGENNVFIGNLGQRNEYVVVPYTFGENSAQAILNTMYYHAHGKEFLYPDKADSVTLTSSANAWSEAGTIVEIIPANTIIKTFDLHWTNISYISAELEGVIDLFMGLGGAEIQLTSIPVVRSTALAGERESRIQINQLPANTRISARFSDNTALSRTVKIKLKGHVYSGSLT